MDSHHNQDSQQVLTALLGRFAPVTDDPNIRERRHALGLSQRTLAAAAGCSLTSLANIEAGVTRKGFVLVKIRETLELHEAERLAA